jgi:hypothetical protein
MVVRYIAAVLTDTSFDYIARPRKGEKQFTIHIPSHMHEGMAGALGQTIVQWYGNIRDGLLCKNENTLEATKGVAQKLGSSLAARVRLNDETRQEPGLSFTFNRGKIAGLMVEVAWSQSKLKLPERAERYVKESKGKIRQARFDAKDEKCTRVILVDQQVGVIPGVLCRASSNDEYIIQLFIGDDGSPIKASALILSLKDFICEEDANEEDDFEDVMLEITWKELHRFYEDSLQPHVCAETDDEKELVIKDMKEVLKKTIELEKALHELKTPSSEEQKVLGSEHSAKARKRLDDRNRTVLYDYMFI